MTRQNKAFNKKNTVFLASYCRLILKKIVERQDLCGSKHSKVLIHVGAEKFWQKLLDVLYAA